MDIPASILPGRAASISMFFHTVSDITEHTRDWVQGLCFLSTFSTFEVSTASLDSFHAKIKYILFLSWLPCIENFQNCDSKETVYAGLTLIFEAA